MGERSIPGFCERCGRPFEVDRPAPGDRELGLDRIKAAFRFCSTCRLFVGRTCCWNPDALECIVDAPVFALSTTVLPGGRADSSTTDAALSRGLEELGASLDNLEAMEWSIDRVRQVSSDAEVGRRAWNDAWWTAGWIIARVETSRDVAAKALWHTSATPDGLPAQSRMGELIGLQERYSRARSLVDAHLRAAGKSLAARRRPRWTLPLGRRIQPTAFAGALMAVVVLSFSTAALLQLGYLDPFASSGSAVTGDGPEGDVLGGVTSQLPSSSSSPTATPPAPQTVIARLDFDVLRIGPLAGASDALRSVKGTAEVVAFPSPFDRSIRLLGEGSHQFCVLMERLEGGASSFEMDLFSSTPLSSGRLRLLMAPIRSRATAASVPLETIGRLRLDAWHHLGAVWTPGQPVAIAIEDAAQGPPQTLTVPPVAAGRAAPGTVCVAVSGMAKNAELLIDNLRVQQ